MSVTERTVQVRPHRRAAPTESGQNLSIQKLTASYVTLAGAGFTEPPRFTFRQRCEAASAAGFARIGIHLNDLETLDATDVADILSDNDLELGEIEFFAGWAALGSNRPPSRHWRRCASSAAATGGGDHLARVTSLAAHWISTVPRSASRASLRRLPMSD